MAKLTHEEAKAALETALTNYMRLNRDDEDNQLFIQDYVILLASESMEPGKENVTYHDCINRSMMAKYSIIGLLHSGLGYYNENHHE